MFEKFYASAFHHPILLWVAPILFLIRVPLIRDAFSTNAFRRALLVFTILTLIDPLMTGPISAYGSSQLGWSPGTLRNIMLVFVLLGDFRVFYFVERWRGIEPPGRFWVRAVALCLVVPLLQLVLIKGFPVTFAEPRHTFVAYELLFLIFAFGYRKIALRDLPKDDETAVFLRRVIGFAMGYYALWAAADFLILSGWDLGFGLRLIPNLLYYGLFLPFVYARAPAHIKGRGGDEP